VANDEGLRNEAAASQQAAALATGRRLSSPSTIRRIPIKGPTDPDEAEERRRKGREYLAQRNQQMYELQQRRKAAARANGDATPPTPTFDALVDSTGMLKTPDEEEEKELPMLPSPPTNEPVSGDVRAEMKEVARDLSQPMLAEGPSSSGWQVGSAFANPFGDEFEMERSITSKPPVPPKIALERVPDPEISVPEGLEELTPIEPRPEPEPVDHSHLSYEEQLAIALSLSEQDSPANAAGQAHTRSTEEHQNVQAAIAASLKDIEDRSASQPLVDLSPSTPIVSPQRSDWERMFDSNRSINTSRLPPSNSNDAQSEMSDELYRVTPQLTRARLANLEAQQGTTRSSLPFDPVRDAASITVQAAAQDTMDASFYSAFDDVSPAAPPADNNNNTQLIDVSDTPQEDGTKTPTTQAHSSFGFQTDSDTETFASISQPASSRAQSRPRSEMSGIEVVDVDEDSDADVLSDDEGDGVTTPDSWSEVGSRDGESDVEEGDVRQVARVEG
jgi:hypothetical protein